MIGRCIVFYFKFSVEQVGGRSVKARLRRPCGCGGFQRDETVGAWIALFQGADEHRAVPRVAQDVYKRQ